MSVPPLASSSSSRLNFPCSSREVSSTSSTTPSISFQPTPEPTSRVWSQRRCALGTSALSSFLGRRVSDRSSYPSFPSTPHSLLSFLDDIPAPDRTIDSPFLPSISQKYPDFGTVVAGKIESDEYTEETPCSSRPTESVPALKLGYSASQIQG